MAKNISDKILEKVVKPYTNKKFDTVRAIVVNYDNIRNRAKISFQDPNTTGKIELANVPVQLASYEMHSTSLQKGDSVWVSFVNGSPLMPKIISLADEDYELKTRERLNHLRGGCLKTNISHVEPIENITSVIDPENTDILKYLEFENFDIGEKILEFKNSLGYFSSDEVGITHKDNDSVIKINKNGTIDIFGRNNQGIRIDPTSYTIHIDSSSIKETHMNKESKIDKWSISCDDINIITKNISLECDKLIINGEEKNV